jgi:3D (Asp-Asp-Asp) domain-containing protein
MRPSPSSIGLLMLMFTALAGGPVFARSMIVTATAYNATRAQTDSTPRIGACNKPFKPGAKLLAVSPDLMRAGLTCGTKVKVKGFGDFTVWDEMDNKWRRRIDILMGRKLRKAEKWGEKKVRISW